MAVIDTVIVAYNSADVIEGSMRAAGPLGGTTVVVDHGDGESARRAAALGATTVRDPRNPGFGAGQNRGVAATTSPFVLLCNPDAEVDPAAVESGADFLEAHPHVAAVQGVVLNRRTGDPERSQGVALGPVHLVGRAVGARRLLGQAAVRRLARWSPTLRDHADRVPSHPVDVESLAATVLLVRRSAFESVGGFDTSYFLYGEDLDLCLRLRRTGWRLVTIPDVWAVHQSGGSAASTRDREVYWWCGTMQYAACWWTTGQWCVAVFAAAIEASRLTLACPCDARSAWLSVLVAPLRVRLRRAPTS